MTKRKGSQDQADRLQYLLDKLNVKALAFSKAVKVSQSFVSLIVNGKQDITHNLVRGINDAYPDVNTGWLLTGKGDMFLSDDAEKRSYTVEVSDRDVPLYSVNIKRIRDRWDMGQTHFGDLLGASRNQVSHWERGRTEPDWESLQQLEALTGIPQATLRTVELTNDDIPARPGTKATLETQTTLKEISDRLDRIEGMLRLLLEGKTSGS